MNQAREKIKIAPIEEFDLDKINSFLKNQFPIKTAESIIKQGQWKSRGIRNRLILTVDNRIAGYFSLIPIKVAINNKSIPAYWWVDLIIDKLERGKGYQTFVDRFIRDMPNLKLGFPNENAALVHNKHDWVVMENHKILLNPLIPKYIYRKTKDNLVQKLALIIITPLISLLMKIIKIFIGVYKVKWSRKIYNPDPSIFSNTFSENISKDLITTWRDLDFFKWRYFSCPNKDQLNFYVSEKSGKISHYCITRKIKLKGRKILRILDLYGNLDDQERIKDILMLIVKEAQKDAIYQITSLVTIPTLIPIYYKCGFILSAKSRFCWHSNEPNIKSKFNGTVYWTLGDSDNDQ